MPPEFALQTICDRVASCWPMQRWAAVRTVVGVSGGADSVCLLRTLQQMNPNATAHLVVAHYDHQMRTDSASDATFVRDLAIEMGLRCELGRSETPDALRSEAALRGERYDFLEAVGRRVGARYVAVAHNRDDQVETILHNILRGTGGSGMRGVPPFRSLGEDLVLARPLLNVSRETIEAALGAINQPYRTDPSNAQPTWTRNWLRGELLPLLRERFPQADDALLRLGSNVGELQAAVDQHARDVESEALVYSAGSVQFATKVLRMHPEAVVVSLLQRAWDNKGWPRGEMTHGHWKRLTKLLTGLEDRESCPQFHLPGNVLVQSRSESLRLSRPL